MTMTTSALGTGYKVRSLDRDVEHGLVRRAQGGDSEAFGRLYEGLVDPIYRYIFFRVTDENTAEDLTSRVFMKAWEHLPNYKEGKTAFLAWLYRIAHNTVIDYYRVHKQTSRLDDIISLASDEPSPDEELQRHIESDGLRKALWQLTKMQREVITLRLISGMRTEEVADQLGKTPGAIRALQMRALQALAKIMKDVQKPEELIS